MHERTQPVAQETPNVVGASLMGRGRLEPHLALGQRKCRRYAGARLSLFVIANMTCLQQERAEASTRTRARKAIWLDNESMKAASSVPALASELRATRPLRYAKPLA
jgi:hypothetical protein